MGTGEETNQAREIRSEITKEDQKQAMQFHLR